MCVCVCVCCAVSHQFCVDLEQHIATVAAHTTALLHVLPLKALGDHPMGQADRRTDGYNSGIMLE